MTVYAIFGNAGASDKLLRSSMSELLETHNQFTPTEDFLLIVAGDNDALNAVRYWALDADVDCDGADTPLIAVDVAWNLGKSNARVLALIGDDEPTGDVAQALALATKHSMEIRDLAEAGITYVYIEGDPPTTQQENEMPRMQEEEVQEEAPMTWEEVGAEADAGDQGMMLNLSEVVEILNADRDEKFDVEAAKSWSEVADWIQEREDDETAAEVEPETPNKPDEDEDALGFTQEDFVGKGLKEVRELAVQSGVKDAAKLGKRELVAQLCGMQPETDEDESTNGSDPEPHEIFDDEVPVVLPERASGLVYDEIVAIADLIANAVANKLANRLLTGD